MNHIAIGEDADDLTNRIALSDIGQKLISQARPFRGALHDSSDIYKGDWGWNQLFRSEELGKFGQPRIGYRHDADIWLNSGEGIIGGQNIVLGQSIKKGGLTDIWQSDDSDR